MQDYYEIVEEGTDGVEDEYWAEEYMKWNPCVIYYNLLEEEFSGMTEERINSQSLEDAPAGW